MAQQQQQQQQQTGNNGGGHTPAPSPGPVPPMFNPSGPQSLPQQFPMYPGVFIPPGVQQAMMSPQGQGLPPPHQVHQYAMQHQGKYLNILFEA